MPDDHDRLLSARTLFDAIVEDVKKEMKVIILGRMNLSMIFTL